MRLSCLLAFVFITFYVLTMVYVIATITIAILWQDIYRSYMDYANRIAELSLIALRTFAVIFILIYSYKRRNDSAESASSAAHTHIPSAILCVIVFVNYDLYLPSFWFSFFNCNWALQCWEEWQKYIDIACFFLHATFAIAAAFFWRNEGRLRVGEGERQPCSWWALRHFISMTAALSLANIYLNRTDVFFYQIFTKSPPDPRTDIVKLGYTCDMLDGNKSDFSPSQKWWLSWHWSLAVPIFYPAGGSLMLLFLVSHIAISHDQSHHSEGEEESMEPRGPWELRTLPRSWTVVVVEICLLGAMIMSVATVILEMVGNVGTESPEQSDWWGSCTSMAVDSIRLIAYFWVYLSLFWSWDPSKRIPSPYNYDPLGLRRRVNSCITEVCRRCCSSTDATTEPLIPRNDAPTHDPERFHTVAMSHAIVDQAVLFFCLLIFAVPFGLRLWLLSTNDEFSNQALRAALTGINLVCAFSEWLLLRRLLPLKHSELGLGPRAVSNILTLYNFGPLLCLCSIVMHVLEIIRFMAYECFFSHKLDLLSPDQTDEMKQLLNVWACMASTYFLLLLFNGYATLDWFFIAQRFGEYGKYSLGRKPHEEKEQEEDDQISGENLHN